MTAEPVASNSSSAHPDAANRPYREVTDSHGRLYRVGESDRDILGHSRKLMVYLPWIAMMAISVFEYAYGSAEDTLSHAHGWTQSNTFWILSVWVFFQAGIAFPTGRLREKGILTARGAMYAGSLMCVVGFLALSHLSNVWLAILGFGVVGGVGAGLVYATCINVVGKWFPERRGAKTGFVNGGFAYGLLPFTSGARGCSCSSPACPASAAARSTRCSRRSRRTTSGRTTTPPTTAWSTAAS